MVTRKIVGSGMGLNVAKEMLWLAWQACGGPVGMGFLQDRPGASKEDVWNGMAGASDYQGSLAKQPKEGEVYGDYVFGRMMKILFNFGDDFIAWDTARDVADSEYQSWARKYPTMSTLFDAAMDSLTAPSKQRHG